MSASASRRQVMTGSFNQHFGHAPALWVRAPGRVDLMGSHTDYNLGYVLTLPIARDTWVALRARDDRQVRLFSLNLERGNGFGLDAIERQPGQAWCNYVRGVASVLQREGLAFQGFDAVIHSTIPISSGLSSSAALECAIATGLEALSGRQLDPVKKAQLCQAAENDFVGVNCGILDQYTSCLGQEGCALLLDCRDLTSRPVRLARDIQVVICDTKSKRELAGSEYGTRRAQCEEGARRLGRTSLRELPLAEFYARETELPAEIARRCRFILEEHHRVPQLAEALARGDRDAVGKLTAESFHGACQLYEIGAPPMTAMMKSMRQAPGLVGARQAGAGFGGCMVAFVSRDSVEAFAESVSRSYRHATGLAPDVYPVEAAPGAAVMS